MWLIYRHSITIVSKLCKVPLQRLLAVYFNENRRLLHTAKHPSFNWPPTHNESTDDREREKKLLKYKATIYTHIQHTLSIIIISSLHFAWVVKDAKCIVVTRVSVSVCVYVLESVRRSFTKRLTGMCTLSYESRLKALGLERLELRRLRMDLVTCYT